MRICIILFVLFSIAACNAPQQKVAVAKVDSANILVSYKYDTLEAAYVGDFGGSDIYIVLSHVTGRHAVGYDMHKGLRRNISGTMKQAGNTFVFQLSEPGDHKFDGKFNFTIDTTTFGLTGTWTPLDKSLAQKSFTLRRLYDTGDDRYATFNLWQDSIGEFVFGKAGNCVYEFYPVVNGKSAEQLIRVKGTWSAKDSIYTVDWEQNTVFPSRRSTFVRSMFMVDSSNNYFYWVLKGEGRTLAPNEF